VRYRHCRTTAVGGSSSHAGQCSSLARRIGIFVLICAQRLNHSAILHVFGCTRGAGQPLQMVMELCDGGSLFERIHRHMTATTFTTFTTIFLLSLILAFLTAAPHNFIVRQAKLAPPARVRPIGHEERVQRRRVRARQRRHPPRHQTRQRAPHLHRRCKTVRLWPQPPPP
jgi:hypothetical protein